MSIKTKTIEKVAYEYIIEDVRQMTRAELLAIATIDLLDKEHPMEDKERLLRHLAVKDWQMSTNQHDHSISLTNIDNPDWYMRAYVADNKIAIDYNTPSRKKPSTTYWSYDEFQDLVM